MNLTKVSYSMINGSVVSVADYGVVGVGDETILICQAMNDAYANGKTLLWPAGSYIVDEANMPSGTNYAPAMIGEGIVTINLAGAVVWQIKNGFTLKNLNFLTTFTYPNTTATYFHLFDTGALATSERLYECVVEDVTYKQTTITDGSERAYGFMRCNGGATNFRATNVQFEGCREGIVFASDGHDGETISTVINARFEQTLAQNMQRVYVFDAIPMTGLFGSIGIDIDDFMFINTLAQRDNYSNVDRTGHSPIIGDLGLNPRINNVRMEYPIEHAIYMYCARGVISNFYGSNPADISITGYTPNSASSVDIHISDYNVVAAHHTATTPIIALRYVNEVTVKIDYFKGTNLSGGPSGFQIRPFCVVSLSRAAKNVFVTAKGQYLNGGVIQYTTNETQEEPYQNIVVKDCFILDAAPTTNSTTFAAINEFLYGTLDPTLPWWTSPSGNLIQNVSILNNYFGQTTDTADTAQTTTVLGRGRSGSKLAGIAKVRNCAGFTAEGNICDGWVGDALTGFSSHHTFGPYMSRVMINDVIQTSNSSISTAISNFPATSEGSFYEIKSKVASNIIGSQAKVLKTQSSAASSTAAELSTSGAEIDAKSTILLGAGVTQNAVYNLTNFSGEVTLQTNSGEYAIANANAGTLTSISVSANAAITDTALKVCIFTVGTELRAKNNTASAVLFTVTQKGSYYV